MNKIIKILIFSALIVVFISPPIVLADSQKQKDVFFKAEVIKILDQKLNNLPGGQIKEQQNLLLFGLEGDYEAKEIEYNGINNYEVIDSRIYKPGDKVMVVASFDADGNANFYITDYVRSGAVWLLFAIFALAVIIIGRWKGLRSLISLLLTFFIIIKFIIPQIINGASPVLITIIGSFIILLTLIYITEGLKLKSHLAVISILISLIITVFISWLFVEMAKLSGLISEDVFSLINIGQSAINFKGLLLAGIIIGALGVLDDVVISQISTVEELIKANKNLSYKEIFSRAYAVGVSHISSMTNTLFLAYAGASLSLLILFLSGESAFSSWSQIINNEQIATEIVRALSGSIGLILSVPIATYTAAVWLKNR